MALSTATYVHFGQCGAQLGEAYWDLGQESLAALGLSATRPLFYRSAEGGAVPRCIIVDSDVTVTGRFVSPSTEHPIFTFTSWYLTY